MKWIALLFFTMSTFTFCNKNSGGSLSAAPVYDPAQSKTLLNEPYGGDTAQRMDVYLPAGRSSDSTPALVLLHGGSWTAGNKTDLNNYIDSFRKRLPHYAIFNLNYRLVSGTTHFDDQEGDIKTALEQIADSAAAYGFSKDRIVLLGVSAGAHLAMLQA